MKCFCTHWFNVCFSHNGCVAAMCVHLNFVVTFSHQQVSVYTKYKWQDINTVNYSLFLWALK